MATQKIEARGWIFEIYDAAGTTWVRVKGVTNFTYNPGENTENVDTTDFDSEGQYEELVLQRGATLGLEGQRRMDSVTGAPDPGQALCDELAQGLVEESLGQIRFRHRLETQWRLWNVTATAGEQGGETNATSSWACDFVRSGAETTTAVS